jgi:hypothetical protein
VDEDQYSYRVFKPLRSVPSVTLPVAVLLVVIAIVSGLVFSGVVQGHEERVGPAQPPTTQPTILIEP